MKIHLFVFIIVLLLFSQRRIQAQTLPLPPQVVPSSDSALLISSPQKIGSRQMKLLERLFRQSLFLSTKRLFPSFSHSLKKIPTRFKSCLKRPRTRCLRKLKKNLKLKRLFFVMLFFKKKEWRSLRLFWLPHSRRRGASFTIRFKRRKNESPIFFAFYVAFSLHCQRKFHSLSSRKRKECRAVSKLFAKKYRVFRVQKKILSAKDEWQYFYSFLADFIAANLKKEWASASLLHLLFSAYPTMQRNPILLANNIAWYEKHRLRAQARRAKWNYLHYFASKTPWSLAHDAKEQRQVKQVRERYERYRQELTQFFMKLCRSKRRYRGVKGRRWRRKRRRFCLRARQILFLPAAKALAFQEEQRRRWLLLETYLEGPTSSESMRLLHSFRREKGSPYRCPAALHLLRIYRRQEKKICRRYRRYRRERVCLSRPLRCMRSSSSPTKALHVLHRKIEGEVGFLLKHCPKMSIASRQRLRLLLVRLHLIYRRRDKMRWFALRFLVARASRRQKKKLSQLLLQSYRRTGEPLKYRLVRLLVHDLPKLSLSSKDYDKLSGVKRVAHFEREGLWKVAFWQYVGLAQRAKNVTSKVRFYEKAARLAERLKNVGEAREFYRKILKLAPHWKGRDRVLFALASSLLEEKPEEAFHLLEELFQSFSRSKYRTKALLLAAKILMKKRKFARALGLLEDLKSDSRAMRRYPEALFDLALVHSRLQDWSKAVQLFKAFIARYSHHKKHNVRVIQAYGELLNIYEHKRRSWRFRRNRARDVLKAYRARFHLISSERRKLLAPYLSKAIFRLVALTYKRKFLKLRIDSSDPEIQRRQLSTMTHLFEKMEHSFAKMPRVRPNRWRLCADLVLAQATRFLHDSIRQMPLPVVPKRRWTPRAKELYRKMLERHYLRFLKEKELKLYRKIVQEGYRDFPKNWMQISCISQAIKTLKAYNVFVPSFRRQLSHRASKRRSPPQKESQNPRHLRCFRGEVEVCSSLVHRYRIRKNVQLARYFLKISCLFGDVSSCFEWAVLLAAKESSLWKALRLHHHLCLGRRQRPSCLYLSQFFQTKSNDDLALSRIYHFVSTSIH